MKLFRTFLPLIIGFLVIACQDGPSEKTIQKPVTTSADVSQERNYKGKEEKILNHLTVKEIPADFPIYKDGETKEEYRTRTIMWAKENLELIKPEYRKKVENFQIK